MRLEYENGMLRIENAAGRRWQQSNVEKTPLGFEFDALLVDEERALRRVGPNVLALNESEIEEVANFIEAQQPPPALLSGA